MLNPFFPTFPIVLWHHPLPPFLHIVPKTPTQTHPNPTPRRTSELTPGSPSPSPPHRRTPTRTTASREWRNTCTRPWTSSSPTATGRRSRNSTSTSRKRKTSRKSDICKDRRTKEEVGGWMSWQRWWRVMWIRINGKGKLDSESYSGPCWETTLVHKHELSRWME